MYNKLALVLVVAAVAGCASPGPGGLTGPGAVAGPEATLAAYRDALQALDVSAAGRLFTADAQIVESGKVEGTWNEYLAHHLGPELGEFSSFTFDDYKANVRRLGDHAWGVETYTYRIVLKDRPEPVERQAVATTVLRREAGAWKILHQHVSSRRPPTAP